MHGRVAEGSLLVGLPNVWVWVAVAEHSVGNARMWRVLFVRVEAL